jgi:general secretion pathway protein F
VTVYAYRGVNRTGKSVKGVRDADSPRALRTTLKREGVMVTEVLERAEAERKRAKDIDLTRFFKRVSTFDVAMATRQLSVLLRSGIPLVEGLSALIDQIEHPDLEAAFTDARDKVNEGKSFAESLRAHPRVFTGLYVNMVAAGEASGTLEAVTARLADFLEGQAQLKNKVTSALAYPGFMMIMTIAILILMMTVVVPQVTGIFANFNKVLPWYTRLMIFFSDILIGYWWLLAIMGGAGAYMFRKWLATPEGRNKWDTRLLTLPILGDLILKVAVARFSRTLATLLSSGVPVLQAMDITKNVLGNTRLMSVVEDARDSVREGEGLAKPLKDSGAFPPIVTHMIAIGERSGQLEEMLEHVGSAYDQQVEMRIATMTSLIEPLIIVFMGVTAGFIAFSVMMPLIQINEFIQ